MKPSLGRIVLVRGLVGFVGIEFEFPAIVTLVVDDYTINATVFIDGFTPKGEAGLLYKEEVENLDERVWRWPPKV